MTTEQGQNSVHTAVLAGHYHGIHSVSNAFITDIFTPFSVLISLRLGASRAVNPLPTRTDDLETRLQIAQRPRIRKGTASLQPLAGRHDYCFRQTRAPT